MISTGRAFLSLMIHRATWLRQAFLVGILQSGCISVGAEGQTPEERNGAGGLGQGESFSPNGVGGKAQGGTSSAATRSVCGQTCQDYLLGWALNDSFWLLWNQYVKGTTVGIKDLSGSCPFGGTFHLTGTTSLDANGTDHVDVRLELTDCANTAARYSLTFTGTLRVIGTFEGAESAAALTFTGSPLTATGNLKYLDNPAVLSHCDVVEVQQGIGESGTLDGRACEREFSSATALRATNTTSGPSGSGGSSSGGSTGGGGGPTRLGACSNASPCASGVCISSRTCIVSVLGSPCDCAGTTSSGECYAVSSCSAAGSVCGDGSHACCLGFSCNNGLCEDAAGRCPY